jgi:hypothetical protein
VIGGEAEASPRESLRQFRANYVNYYLLIQTLEPRPVDIILSTPAERQLTERDLPLALRERLANFVRKNPGTRLSFVKYMRIVNGRPVEVVEGDEDLPEEDELLTLSQTVTLNTAETAELVTELYVARIQRGRHRTLAEEARRKAPRARAGRRSAKKTGGQSR